MRMHIVIALLLLMGSAQGVTLIVCQNGCNHGSIQAAIDAANQGDIIEVQSGMYYEQINVNKDVTLKGIDTGGGRPLILLVYLCGHPDSMITGISFLIMNYGCPSLEQSVIANNISKQFDVPPLRAPGSLWRGKGRANLETIAPKEPKISQNLTKAIEKPKISQNLTKAIEKPKISQNLTKAIEKPKISQNLTKAIEKPKISQNLTKAIEKPRISQNLTKAIEKPRISQNLTKAIEKPRISQNLTKAIEKPKISQNLTKAIEKPKISQNLTKAIEKPKISQNLTKAIEKPRISQNLTKAIEKPRISQNLTKPKASGPMIPSFGKTQTLYYEDFSYSQPIIYPSDYHREFTAGYQARKFHIRVLQADCLSIYDPTKRTPFKDFSLEVEAAKEKGPDDTDYGVVLRRIDANCYYRFWVSGSGSYGFEKLDSGQSTELIPSTKSPSINTGNAANQIRVECYGSHFAFKVNGNEIGNLTDKSFSTGEVGFGVRTHLKGGAEVSFDNLKIYA